MESKLNNNLYGIGTISGLLQCISVHNKNSSNDHVKTNDKSIRFTDKINSLVKQLTVLCMFE